MPAAVLPANSPPSNEGSQAMSTRSVQDHSAGHENFSRRNFLAGATAAAAGLLVVEPRQVAAARGELQDHARPDRLRRAGQLDRQPVPTAWRIPVRGHGRLFSRSRQGRGPAAGRRPRTAPSAACRATSGCWTPGRTPSSSKARPTSIPSRRWPASMPAATSTAPSRSPSTCPAARRWPRRAAKGPRRNASC